jgi:hypothetical protein
MKKLYLFLALFLLTACATAQSVDPLSAQLEAQNAWQQPWRGVWELNWTQSPLPGPLVFAGWQPESGAQRRYEILEAPLASLVGMTYVNNGLSAATYNKLEPDIPVVTATQTLPFSPISDSLVIIDTLLVQTPQSAKEQTAGGAITQFTLHYPQGERLSLWLNTQNNLIIRIELRSQNANLTLAARSLEPLPAPHPKLFEN